MGKELEERKEEDANEDEEKDDLDEEKGVEDVK